MIETSERVVVISLDGDNVVVTGSQLATDRRARLFFRSVLGGEPVSNGWRCPRRRLSIPTLILRVYDWLQQYGYEVERQGAVEQTVSQELERRRSFARTREAAERLKSEGSGFNFEQVDTALEAFGWSAERKLRAHQREGVAHALTVINAANFSVPGSGKTATALAVAATWPDPVFCTRCYESVSTDSNSSGFPASSTFLSRPTAIANSAGVW